MIETPLTKNIKLGEKPFPLKMYEAAGGYQAIRNALTSMTPGQLMGLVADSCLRGRGGAGFPTGLKWASVPKNVAGILVIANGDEMEPGAFKDRFLMEGDPHQLLEGLMLTSFAVGAHEAWIFLRNEYVTAKKYLELAIKECYEANYLGKKLFGADFSLDIKIHMSAGRYMCGEGTALINALEGKRAVPNPRIPYPTIAGYFGKPTVVNNIETLCNIPHITRHGASWFKGLSKSSKDSGTKLYGIAGRTKKTGIWELPMGTTLGELFNDYAGGMQEGYKFRAIIPGGGSTEFLLEKHFNVPLDFESVQKAGSRLGTGTMMVLDQTTDPVKLIHNLIKFFSHESCGWCTPCREGLPWARNLLAEIIEGRGCPDDYEELLKLCDDLGPGRTYCALAPGAVEPLKSGLVYFKSEFDAYIKKAACNG